MNLKNYICCFTLTLFIALGSFPAWADAEEITARISVPAAEPAGEYRVQKNLYTLQNVGGTLQFVKSVRVTSPDFQTAGLAKATVQGSAGANDSGFPETIEKTLPFTMPQSKFYNVYGGKLLAPAGGQVETITTTTSYPSARTSAQPGTREGDILIHEGGGFSGEPLQ